MKFMKCTILSLFLIFCITTLPGMAQRVWTSGAGMYGLDLTDDQMDKIQDLRLEFQKDMLSLSHRLQTLYLELETMERKGEDRSKIDVRIKDLEKLESDMERIYVEHQKQIRSLLSEKQQTLFDEFGGLGLGPAMGMGMGVMRGYAGGMARGLRNGGGRGWGRGAAYAGRGARIGRLGYGYGRAGTGYSRLGAGYFDRTGWNRGPGNRWTSLGARGRFCPRFYFNQQYFYRNRR